MNPNRVFKFPRALIENRDNLQPSTISVAALFYANMNKHRNYRNSLKNIAALTHRDEKTVRQAVTELEAAGYLLKFRNYVYSRELDQMVYAQTMYHIVTPVTADYTLIPYSWLKYELTPCTFQVLLVCRMFMIKEESRSYPSIRKLTDTARVAKSTVCKAIKKVTELGILVLEHCKKENGALGECS
jgi:DNA-binding Lrp family transcriptional regulator